MILGKPLLNLVERRLCALIVEMTARRAAHADRADHFIAGADRHTPAEDQQTVNLSKARGGRIFCSICTRSLLLTRSEAAV